MAGGVVMVGSDTGLQAVRGLGGLISLVDQVLIGDWWREFLAVDFAVGTVGQQFDGVLGFLLHGQ